MVGSSKRMGESPTRLMAISIRRRSPPREGQQVAVGSLVQFELVQQVHPRVCPGSATWRSSPISTRFSRAVSTSSTAADCPVTLICSRTLEDARPSNPATLAVPPSA